MLSNQEFGNEKELSDADIMAKDEEKKQLLLTIKKLSNNATMKELQDVLEYVLLKSRAEVLSGAFEFDARGKLHSHHLVKVPLNLRYTSCQVQGYSVHFSVKNDGRINDGSGKKYVMKQQKPEYMSHTE